MLTKEDIAFIIATRDEVVANRERQVTITCRGAKKRNKITGVTEFSTDTHVVNAIVTDRTSRVAAERRLTDQAEIVEGDLWFSISAKELWGIDPKSIVYVLHDGDKYAVVSQDPKGIGEYNRSEFVGKKVV